MAVFYELITENHYKKNIYGWGSFQKSNEPDMGSFDLLWSEPTPCGIKIKNEMNKNIMGCDYILKDSIFRIGMVQIRHTCMTKQTRW